MIAFIDTSVALRFVLGQPDRLPEWDSIEQGLASELMEVECRRVLDRLRLQGHLSDEELTKCHVSVSEVVEALDVIEVDSRILRRSASPMPTSVGTLDAIHVCSALLWSEQFGEQPYFATHDTQQAHAAVASLLPVIGVAR